MNVHSILTRAKLAGLLLPLLCQLVACSPVTRSWRGKVVGVPSGDTLMVLQGRRQVQVRLHGVGAPTIKQPVGRSAQRLVSRLVLGKVVSVEEVNRGRRDQSYAIVKLGSLGLREILLYTGMGWQIVKYDSSPALGRLERDAQRTRRGVWAGM